MPRQNRVTPFGEIVAVAERGTMMGNRGRLHDARGRFLRPWQVKRWLICLLEFNGRHRQVMAPDRYTELFFLDEATGLAAGHRPCAECRHARFLAFRDAWATGNRQIIGPEPIKAAVIDLRLHVERTVPDRAGRSSLRPAFRRRQKAVARAARISAARRGGAHGHGYQCTGSG